MKDEREQRSVDGPTWHKWCWNGGGPLVYWNFRPMARSDGGLTNLDLAAPDIRRRWLWDFVSRLPALLGDFAYLTETEAGTRSAGAGAFVGDCTDQEDFHRLLGVLEKADDVGWLEFQLTLACLSRDLEPMEFIRGARMAVNILLDDSGALNVTHDAPVYIHFALNCDIYAPFRRGPEGGKNTTLAALNGPRLAGFLERIERDVPTRVLEVEEEVYRGMIGPRGFLAPAGTSSDA